MRADLPLDVTLEVRGRCLCLHLQRAARAMARRFDEALRPVGLTHGQYSLLMALNRPGAPRLGELARFLAMDRTTMTANLKPLERRRLLTMLADSKDKRSRRITLTDAGRDLLVQAVPIWRKTHDDVDAVLGRDDTKSLKADLRALSVD